MAKKKKNLLFTDDMISMENLIESTRNATITNKGFSKVTEDNQLYFCVLATIKNGIFKYNS